MNYALAGRMGAGKDTVAAHMGGYIRLAFGDEIKIRVKVLKTGSRHDLSEILYKDFDEKIPYSTVAHFCRKLKQMQTTGASDRTLTQELGTWCRQQDDLFWVRRVTDRIGAGQKYVITDVRRRNEWAALKKFGNFKLGFVYAPRETRAQRILIRDGYYNPDAEKHIAESEIHDLYHLSDFTIMNNSTEDALDVRVKNFVRFYDALRGKRQLQSPI